jgi:alkylation response protein AidB-like acyl-CoA dehydrogenase
MNRFLIISAQPGNQGHVERLTAAARIALSNRDVQAADKAVRDLGGEGFSTEVTGI